MSVSMITRRCENGGFLAEPLVLVRSTVHLIVFPPAGTRSLSLLDAFLYHELHDYAFSNKLTKKSKK